MNGHINAWIDLYVDGEMGLPQRRQIENHLAGCEDCRNLLAEYGSLSSLLQQAPALQEVKPEKQFIAEVGLQLNRRQNQKQAYPQAHVLSWFTIPIGLFLAYAFVQSVFILNTFLGIIPGNEAWISTQFPALPTWLEIPGPIKDLVLLTGNFNLLNWNELSGWLALAGLGLLYISWLATWWTFNQPKINDFIKGS